MLSSDVETRFRCGYSDFFINIPPYLPHPACITSSSIIICVLRFFYLLLHQDIIRDTDEVYRSVRSPRPEPHQQVNIRRVILGQRLKDALSILFLYFQRCYAILHLFVSSSSHPNCHFNNSNSNTLIVHNYHLFKLFLITIRFCPHSRYSHSIC